MRHGVRVARVHAEHVDDGGIKSLIGRHEVSAARAVGRVHIGSGTPGEPLDEAQKAQEAAAGVRDACVLARPAEQRARDTLHGGEGLGAGEGRLGAGPTPTKSSARRP